MINLIPAVLFRCGRIPLVRKIEGAAPSWHEARDTFRRVAHYDSNASIERITF